MPCESISTCSIMIYYIKNYYSRFELKSDSSKMNVDFIHNNHRLNIRLIMKESLFNLKVGIFSAYPPQ